MRYADPNSDDQCGGKYILDRLPKNMKSAILTYRWLDFLLHRVKRDRLLPLMNYYNEIGWIGSEARSSLLAIARGTLQDTDTYELPEEESELNDDPDSVHYRPLGDYRLSATDHIRSLMFIKRIQGETIDGTDMTELEGDLQTVLGI